MNAKELKDALLRSVEVANEQDASRAAEYYAARPAHLRRLDRAECLLAYFIGMVRAREPELAAALLDFMRIPTELTDKDRDNAKAARELAAGESFSSPAPVPAKAARQ